MDDLPNFLERGERARLFPVLAETSKEGRSASILLACLQAVEEFGRAVLGQVGQRAGTRARIETFTEVSFKDQEKRVRPDGLIIVRNGAKIWTALIEAKVGNAELTIEQVSAYLELARDYKVDALITISNQFASIPTHHPVAVSGHLVRKVGLFHLSWMSFLTQAQLLISNSEVKDRDQLLILNEMLRFLSHDSAGVKGFDQMPGAWTELVGKLSAGGKVAAAAPEVKEVVGAWHQEVGDLTLSLSRQIGANVETRISRAHVGEAAARLKSDQEELARNARLATTLVVPNAASTIEVCADLAKRTTTISMWLKAPQDRQSAKARLAWLLKQLTDADLKGLHVRLIWPGKSVATQFPLDKLREKPEQAVIGREGQSLLSFEVLYVLDAGGRFGQRRNFISDLEAAVPAFYEKVGQHLKAWQPRAPRLQEGKEAPSSVSTEAIQEEAERAAISGDP